MPSCGQGASIHRSLVDQVLARARHHEQGMLGKISDSGFHVDRRRLLESLQVSPLPCSGVISLSLSWSSSCTPPGFHLYYRDGVQQAKRKYASWRCDGRVSPGYRGEYCYFQATYLFSQNPDGVASLKVVEAGAVGIAGLVAASVFDWTGLLGAGAVALTGFVIIPRR